MATPSIISTSSKSIGLIGTLEVDIANTAQRSSVRKINIPSADCLIAVVLPAALLATIQLKTAGVAIFALLTCGAALYQRRFVFSNVNFRILSIILALGIVSAIWSLDPRNTFYYGTQTIITVLAGAVLASSPKGYDTLAGVTLTLICHTMISHVFGKYVLWENGETVFVGVVGVKNYYGGVGGMTVLTSIGLVYAAINRNHRVLAAIAMIGVLAGALGLLRSRATGFTLSTLVCGIVIIYFNVYRVLSPRVRTGLTIYVAYAAIVSAIGLIFLKDDLLRIILHAVHKDVTLTGRTEIWNIGKAAISKRFWLGYGQDGFWVIQNPYAQQIWRLHNMAPTRTFPLHNTYLEIRANLGVVGITTYILVFGTLILRQLFALLRMPTTIGITWISIAFYFLFLMAVESFNLGAMNYNSLFLSLALTFVVYGAKPQSNQLNPDQSRLSPA
jgi:exopolysaccharide production protein ExoQ